MFLAIDIGNSQTSIGVFRKGRLEHHWRVGTVGARTEDEYASVMLSLFRSAGLEGEPVEGVGLCSVVPVAEASVAAFCRKYWSLDPWRIHAGLNLGIGLNVDHPAEVGADRIVNAAFAAHTLSLPQVVLDFGTATTFDLITADKVYQGGAILPGIRLAVEALGGKTAQLPVVDLKFPRSVIGKNTIECIQSGILLGYADLIDGMLARFEKEVGPLSVTVTGGFAALLDKQIRYGHQFSPDFTLEGIAYLHQHFR